MRICKSPPSLALAYHAYPHPPALSRACVPPPPARAYRLLPHVRIAPSCACVPPPPACAYRLLQRVRTTSSRTCVPQVYLNLPGDIEPEEFRGKDGSTLHLWTATNDPFMSFTAHRNPDDTYSGKASTAATLPTLPPPPRPRCHRHPANTAAATTTVTTDDTATATTITTTTYLLTKT
eukprot:302695-Chlamydomonas_euryale.AAC.1